MSQFEVELVVYDETENFRAWNDPQFDYPYAVRKRKEASFTLIFNSKRDNYEFASTNLVFKKSVSCLQDPWFKQLLFFKQVFIDGFDLIKDAFSAEKNVVPSLDPDADECTSTFFKKIMLLKSIVTHKVYSLGTSFNRALAE